MDPIATEVELALLRLMLDTSERRWWNYNQLGEALADFTRNQIVSGVGNLRRRGLVTPNHRSLGQSDFTITTGGELLMRQVDQAPDVEAFFCRRGS